MYCESCVAVRLSQIFNLENNVKYIMSLRSQRIEYANFRGTISGCDIHIDLYDFQGTEFDLEQKLLDK